jgi:FeS assembly SUF system protein
MANWNEAMNEQSKIEIEEVEAVSPPPKARVSDAAEAFERKRDYLEGFLAQQPKEPAPVEPGGSEPILGSSGGRTGGSDLYEGVIDALKDIYDPEIPVNIYDLGLIYDVEVTPEGHAFVKMTLTTPHCPVAESMPGEVELRVGAVPGIGHAEVELVWDPPWDPQKMSDEAKLELGML